MALEIKALPKDATRLQRDVHKARKVGTPLIGIHTPDATATIAALAPVLNGAPVMTWDVVRGLRGYTDKGIIAAKTIAPQAAATLNPTEFLSLIEKAPEDSAIYMLNAHLFLTQNEVRQAVWNLRDQFKGNGRTLIMLGASLAMPIELDGDVMMFDEPLPDRAAVGALIRQQFKNAELKTPVDAVIEKATDATVGLKPYSIEQNTAMALQRDGIDVLSLQQQRCTIIEATPGLSVHKGDESFATIGGNENVKRFMTRLIGGQDKIGGVVWIDELEKQVAGKGDTSGVGQDQIMQLLTYMQNRRVPALLLVGMAGTGKSEIAKAAGHEADVVTLSFDLGGMMDQFVGSSQQRIRAALKTVDGVTGERPLFIATCNDLSALSAELRSRFRLGTFFFDLPTVDERKTIWNIHIKKNNLTTAQIAGLKSGAFDESGWTGREISTCCDLAWRLSTTLEDASQYVVPIATSQRDVVERSRDAAEHKFISAAYPGTYRREVAAELPAEQPKARKINVTD